jgi:hypothetical protein
MSKFLESIVAASLLLSGAAWAGSGDAVAHVGSSLVSGNAISGGVVHAMSGGVGSVMSSAGFSSASHHSSGNGSSQSDSHGTDASAPGAAISSEGEENGGGLALAGIALLIGVATKRLSE